jgi:hypothetical protein
MFSRSVPAFERAIKSAGRWWVNGGGNDAIYANNAQAAVTTDEFNGSPQSKLAMDGCALEHAPAASRPGPTHRAIPDPESARMARRHVCIRRFTGPGPLLSLNSVKPFLLHIKSVEVLCFGRSIRSFHRAIKSVEQDNFRGEYAY